MPDSYRTLSSLCNNKNGYDNHLIIEEKDISDHNVFIKCIEIHSAVSKGNISALDMEEEDLRRRWGEGEKEKKVKEK
ncbi:hypothetical protein Fmac_012258 [Flemingia macrophylla]|uniref:Uncharacterized protein n=1 Tax=Flemingia macrophylla TaxID=520843 RepID=A0ABD1MPS3_9FABA